MPYGIDFNPAPRPNAIDAAVGGVQTGLGLSNTVQQMQQRKQLFDQQKKQQEFENAQSTYKSGLLMMESPGFKAAGADYKTKLLRGVAKAGNKIGLELDENMTYSSEFDPYLKRIATIEKTNMSRQEKLDLQRSVLVEAQAAGTQTKGMQEVLEFGQPKTPTPSAPVRKTFEEMSASERVRLLDTLNAEYDTMVDISSQEAIALRDQINRVKESLQLPGGQIAPPPPARTQTQPGKKSGAFSSEDFINGF